ncbi:MAG: hypothetical protein J6R99_04660 [Alphaproteobacteria bacterium]|nr:hypothetical protein [Alphaproteobacteria bacterium]
MFQFDLFSYADWHKLAHAELRGFPGFVFGILVLSAVPVYAATTALIIRTKKPLFTIPVPGFIKTFWSHMQPTLINPPATEIQDAPKKEETKSANDGLPSELPSELRTAYIRARMNITPEQRSSFNQPTPTQTAEYIPETSPSTPDEIPLPTDFDIDISPEDTEIFTGTDFSQMTVPTFSDLNFDSDTPEKKSNTDNSITEYLNSKSIKYDIENEFIITDKLVIASHTDPDFWICDGDDWFATGKQRKSPIPELLQIASTRKLTPIIYLGATNILEVDDVCRSWKSSGITVVLSPGDIAE